MPSNADIFQRMVLNRRFCDSEFDDDCDNNGDWYFWGRWVLLGVIVVVILFLVLSCTCIARRRRMRGAQPYYGTGWLAGNKYNNSAYGNQQYPMNNYGGGGYANPPPAYGQQREQQYTGTTYNPNDGYYGNNYNSGVTSPPAAYQSDPYGAPPK